MPINSQPHKCGEIEPSIDISRRLSRKSLANFHVLSGELLQNLVLGSVHTLSPTMCSREYERVREGSGRNCFGLRIAGLIHRSYPLAEPFQNCINRLEA